MNVLANTDVNPGDFVAVTFSIDTFREPRERPSPPTGVVTRISSEVLADPVDCGVHISEWSTDLTADLERGFLERVSQYASRRLKPRDTTTQRNCFTFAMAAAGHLSAEFIDEETALFNAPAPRLSSVDYVLENNDEREQLLSGEAYGFFDPNGKFVHAIVGMPIRGLHLAVEERWGSLVVRSTRETMPYRGLAHITRLLKAED